MTSSNGSPDANSARSAFEAATSGVAPTVAEGVPGAPGSPPPGAAAAPPVSNLGFLAASFSFVFALPFSVAARATENPKWELNETEKQGLTNLAQPCVADLERRLGLMGMSENPWVALLVALVAVVGCKWTIIQWEENQRKAAVKAAAQRRSSVTPQASTASSGATAKPAAGSSSPASQEAVSPLAWQPLPPDYTVLSP